MAKAAHAVSGPAHGLALGLGLALVLASPAAAQLGAGESAAGDIDLRPPELVITAGPPSLVVGGTVVSLRWTMAEPLPGPAGSHVARVLIGKAPADSLVAASAPGSFEWNWTVHENTAVGCRFQITAADARGNRTIVQSQPFTIIPSWTAVPALPATPVLLPPRPNPCNPAAEISWVLPAAGHLRLLVHDLRGRRIAVLVDGETGAGPNSLRWEARDGSGRRVPAGVYHLRLEYEGPSGAFAGSRRLVVLP